MRKLLWIASTATVLLLAPGARLAQAQFVTPIREGREGRGILLTDNLVVHPGVALETRWDSNVLNIGDSGEGAAFLRLVGHFDIATRPVERMAYGEGAAAPQRIEFRLRSALAYREYLSSQDQITQQRALEVDAGLLFKAALARVLALHLSDDYQRSISPRNGVFVPVAGTQQEIGQVSRNLNRATAKALLTPGGGRLSLALGYSLLVDSYEESEFSTADRMFHEVRLEGRYKLLPKTAVLLDVVQQFYDYWDQPAVGYTNVNSKPLRIYAGLIGLITSRLSTTLKVGYGNSFYDSGSDFNSLLARAELGYAFSPMAKLTVGYERLFEDSPYANFFTDHKAFVGYDHIVARRVQVHLSADYRFREFEGFEVFATRLAAEPSPRGTDTAHLFTLNLGADYYVRDWIYFGAGYDLQLQNWTDDAVGAVPIVGLVDFTRHQLYGRVGVSY